MRKPSRLSAVIAGMALMVAAPFASADAPAPDAAADVTSAVVSTVNAQGVSAQVVPPRAPSLSEEERLALNKQHRLALVIGNGAYTAPNSALPNPPRDADAIRATLEPFVTIDTNSAHDLPAAKLYPAFSAFARDLKAQQAEIAIVYFSGHGLQDNGDDYLLQTDLQSTYMTDDLKKALALSRMISVLAAYGAKAQIYILDACRTNSFVKSLVTAENLTDPRATAIPGVSMGTPAKGLTSEFPKNSIPGVLVAFATSPGGTASDGAAGTHGAYTTYLLGEIAKPELAQKIFDTVHDLVLKNVPDQEPWNNSAMGNLPVYIRRWTSDLDLEFSAWLDAQESDNPIVISAFLEYAQNHGFSEFLPEAQKHLQEVCKAFPADCALLPAPVVVAAAEPAPAAVPTPSATPAPPAAVRPGQVGPRTTFAVNAPSVILDFSRSLTKRPTHVFATAEFKDVVASIPASEPLTIMRPSGEQTFRAVLAGKEIGFVKAADLPQKGAPQPISVAVAFQSGRANLTSDSLGNYATFVADLSAHPLESMSIITNGDIDTPVIDNTALGLIRAEAIRKSILASLPDVLKRSVQFHLSTRSAQDPDKTGQITAVLSGSQ